MILKLLLVFMKKKKLKNSKWDDWNNNDLEAGCFIIKNFPCADEETTDWEKHFSAVLWLSMFIA